MFLLVLPLLVINADPAIFDAIRNDHLDVLRSLIDSKNINLPGPGQQTPLMAATLQGKAEIVEYLLSAGANPSIEEKDGYTPMHGAGFQGRANVAKVLIAAGLDPNDRHSDGFTPLHRACWGREQRHTDTVQVFLEAGVDPNQRDSAGRTPIELTSNPKTKALLQNFLKNRKEL
eukprot:c11272_g1_i1.p1 GENE.c11272_g1_i1~~c11272_g1_i1.p1  ORF type:complete len:174 (-),score=45.44 c11272_g1_i1:68-589(-)